MCHIHKHITEWAMRFIRYFKGVVFVDFILYLPACGVIGYHR